jgi:hypothetical protein
MFSEKKREYKKKVFLIAQTLSSTRTEQKISHEMPAASGDDAFFRHPSHARANDRRTELKINVFFLFFARALLISRSRVSFVVSEIVFDDDRG